jgi:hypothetical protein
MSGVFRNIHPPSLPGECVPPPPLVQGEDTLAGWRGGGGSIVRKTPDTALYSIYVSTLCSDSSKLKIFLLQKLYYSGFFSQAMQNVQNCHE